MGLIHGCTQGPTGWMKVQQQLSDRGITSTAVDLEPSGFNESGAIACAEEICRQLADVDRLVLVSTSCSGLLAPIVATMRPVEQLVFVCAGLPDIGRSAAAQIAEDGVLHRDWMQVEFDPEDAETAEHYMFHDCPAENMEWSMSTVRLLLPPRVCMTTSHLWSRGRMYPPRTSWEREIASSVRTGRGAPCLSVWGSNQWRSTPATVRRVADPKRWPASWPEQSSASAERRSRTRTISPSGRQEACGSFIGTG